MGTDTGAGAALQAVEQGPTAGFDQCFGDFLREGIADGTVRSVDTFVAQNLIAGAVNASMDIRLWRKVEDIDATALDYFDIFFNGLLRKR